MDTLSFRTKSINSQNADKKWWLVDLNGEVLGRAASKIAKILRGKHKTNFTPHADCGDFVVVINAEKVLLTGNKANDKEYMRFTGYPSGQRVRSFQYQISKHPHRVIESAVRGMLPKNKLGRKIFKNLYVYVGENHNQEAQKPKLLNLNQLR